MNKIYYFSSTGNSLYVAKRIKAELGGEIVYIPEASERSVEAERLIIVSPVYSFGLPAHVYDFINGLVTDAPVYIVLTYGGMLGGADRLAYELLKRRRLDVRACFTVKAVENFTLDFTVPNFYKNAALKKLPSRVDEVIEGLKRGERVVPKAQKTKEQTYLKNMKNWHIIGKRFSVTSACTGCKKCVSLCPAGNISMTDGRIVFSDGCVACLGCYHRCPSRAIIYKGKRKKDRYICPLVTESEIGRSM